MMKKMMLFLVAGLLLMSTSAMATSYSVGWYEPFPATPITEIEAFITGGTFTGPLTGFTQGNNNAGPALPGWSSFVAGNYPQTAVVANGPAESAVSFYINFTGDNATIDFYSLDNGVLAASESWNFDHGQYTGQNGSTPDLPTNVPVPTPEPGTMMLLGAGFLGLAVFGKRRKNA